MIDLPTCPVCGTLPVLRSTTMALVGTRYQVGCSLTLMCGLSASMEETLEEASLAWSFLCQALSTIDGTPIRELTREQVRL